MFKKLLITSLLSLSFFVFIAQSKALAVDTPLTPITTFSLTGTVTYRNLFARPSVPFAAEGVTVTLKNIFNQNDKKTVQTDISGKYQINVTPGLYLVDAKDNKNTSFVPPVQFVRVEAGVQRTQNFQGLLFNLQ